MKKIVTLTLFQAVLLISCGQPGGRGAEILWDTWGVPHIYSQNEEGLFYAFGWAQMVNHGDLLLRLYGRSRGRGAEYWGESYMKQDRHVRIMGVPERAREWYRLQNPAFRRNLDAFAAGINAYATAHRDRIDDEVEVVLPVSAEDIFAHLQYVIHLNFIGGGILSGVRNWEDRGSNAWAVGPSRSASGNAMLIANPHLPWSDFFTWMEAQLTGPGVNAYGATLIGFPVLGIAFNNHLGWTHTNNTIDGMDLYEVTLAEGGYIWDGQTRPFEVQTQTLKVKDANGALSEKELVIHRTIHGPVLAEKEDKAIAVRLVGLDQPYLAEQYWDMVRATSLDEFQDALSRLQMPFFNVIYADRDGRIMYLFGGRVPERPKGDWNFWRGIIPGEAPGLLWTDTHPYGDLPRVIDPRSGWVQNANDPPWTSTFPMVLDPDDFPPYMAPRGASFRVQRSLRMINSDEQITFEELHQYKHSTRMELADRICNELIDAARQHGGDLAEEAAQVLDSWDRHASTNSRGAVLFAAWVREMLRSGTKMFAQPWNEAAPRTTPRGLGNPPAAVAALEKAAEAVRADFGTLDVPWGEAYRLRYAGKDLPANGGTGQLGLFRVLDYDRDEDGRYRATGGDSYVALIEFSNPVRAKTLVSYGNATQPVSPHRGDQLELFSRQELRPVWRTRKEVEAHLERKEVF